MNQSSPATGEEPRDPSAVGPAQPSSPSAPREAAAEAAPEAAERAGADPHDARLSAGTGAHPTAPQPRLEVVRLLEADGTRREHERFSAWLPELSTEDLQSLHRAMVRARRLDEMATALQRQGEMALWPPLRGQEAAQVGAARAQAPSDVVFPSYREHALVMERGIRAEQVLLPFRGLVPSGWDPAETRTHVYSMVLGSQVPHAVGYAMGLQQDVLLAEQAGQPAPEPAAVTVCFGDGASTEGEVHESMVFAASYDAPVVFFVQNNQWAISVPFSTQSRLPLAERAAGYGFEGVRVDGNDPLAVLAVMRWALEEARTGRGPVLVEAETFRLGAHTTADDPTKYRLTDEEQLWAPRDPLVRMQALLEAQGVGEDWFAQLEEETSSWLAQVRETVLSSEPVSLDQRFDVAYAAPHPLVERERAWLREYRESFAADDDTTGGRA